MKKKAFGVLFYNDSPHYHYWNIVKFFLDHPLNLVLLGLILLSGGALLFPLLQRRGAKLSSLQATQLMNREKALILDIRVPTEFGTGHIRNAKNIAQAELSNKLGELKKSKNKPIIVVCQSGHHSARASARLKKAGFEKVYHLDGGLNAWQTQGLPVAK